jgi:hypothetical protein
MKLDFPINQYSLIGYQRPKSVHKNTLIGESKENTSINRGYNSGSSSVSFGSAANFSLKTLNKLNTLCADSGVIAGSLIALFYAVGLRPAAIMSLPGKKDKDDKIYASGHAMASGIIGFVFSSIVMSPLDAASKKVKEEATLIKNRIEEVKNEGKTADPKELVKDLKYLNEKFVNIFGKFKDGKVSKFQNKKFENTIKILEFAPDTLFFGIMKAMLTIALIPPILKYVFGVEKKSAKAAQQNTNPVANIPATARPELKSFIGGLK